MERNQRMAVDVRFRHHPISSIAGTVVLSLPGRNIRMMEYPVGVSYDGAQRFSEIKCVALRQQLALNDTSAQVGETQAHSYPFASRRKHEGEACGPRAVQWAAYVESRTGSK